MLLIQAATTLLLQLFVAANNPAKSWRYTTVTGYFAQDDSRTNATGFDFRATNFGLLNRTYPDEASYRHRTQWQRFAKQVAKLQHEASRNVDFKVLFLGRHGEGYHNAAEAYFGSPAWNCFYSIVNGNDTVTWADAELTSNGKTQATLNHDFWADEIDHQKIPSPQSFYTSPLTRCLQTAGITFSGLNLRHPFVPTVKEFFREGISGHTCDRRRSRTYIRDKSPTYESEKGFAENDPLFQPLHAETRVDQNIRSKNVLDDVFQHDRSTYISITSHSGEIASLLEGTLSPRVAVFTRY